MQDTANALCPAEQASAVITSYSIHYTKLYDEFGAQASAVAVSAGASADADYDKGVAIFTHVGGGLMAEASVGGQKFTYENL